MCVCTSIMCCMHVCAMFIEIGIGIKRHSAMLGVYNSIVLCAKPAGS